MLWRYFLWSSLLQSWLVKKIYLRYKMRKDVNRKKMMKRKRRSIMWNLRLGFTLVAESRMFRPLHILGITIIVLVLSWIESGGWRLGFRCVTREWKNSFSFIHPLFLPQSRFSSVSSLVCGGFFVASKRPSWTALQTRASNLTPCPPPPSDGYRPGDLFPPHPHSTIVRASSTEKATSFSSPPLGLCF